MSSFGKLIIVKYLVIHGYHILPVIFCEETFIYFYSSVPSISASSLSVSELKNIDDLDPDLNEKISILGIQLNTLLESQQLFPG